MILLWTIIVSSVIQTALATCNGDTGPAGGSPKCVLLTPFYTDYQWATCLTDVYIRTKSEGRHQCKDRSRTYCYYQCMIEIHNDNGSGPVFDDCACSPNDVYTTSQGQTTPVPIPSWCFSPSGDNCLWFRECLARYHPCHGSREEYAVSFAEHFCKLYDNFYNYFNQNGQKWINAVRKCLQVQLVPILRPWLHKSCSEINQMALDSHSFCYNSPANEVNYCSLTRFQLSQIFWTLKSALQNTTEDTVGEFYDIMTECANSSTDNYSLFKQFQLELKNISNKNHRHRPSRDKRQNTVTEKFIPKFVATVAANQHWYEQGIIWYGRQSKNNSVGLTVDFTIASRREFDLNAGDNVPSANLTFAVDELKEDLRSGKLSFHVMNETLQVLSMNGCDDLGCRHTHNEVTVTYTDNKSSTSTVASKDFVFGFSCGLLLAVGVILIM